MLLGTFVVKHDLHNHLTICSSTPIDYDNRDDKLQVQNSIEMQLGKSHLFTTKPKYTTADVGPDTMNELRSLALG